MEYKIIKTNDYYFPKTERWIMESFGLNAERAMFYQMILNKGYICWSQDWMAEVLGCSRDKIKDTLKLFVDMDIVAKQTVNVAQGGVRQRSVYVAKYTSNGKRSDAELESLLKDGVRRLFMDYEEKRYYKKNKDCK